MAISSVLYYIHLVILQPQGKRRWLNTHLYQNSSWPRFLKTTKRTSLSTVVNQQKIRKEVTTTRRKKLPLTAQNVKESCTTPKVLSATFVSSAPTLLPFTRTVPKKWQMVPCCVSLATRKVSRNPKSANQMKDHNNNTFPPHSAWIYGIFMHFTLFFGVRFHAYVQIYA